MHTKLSVLAATLGTAALFLPGVALAHGSNHNHNQAHHHSVKAELENESGLKMFDDKGLHLGEMGLPGLFYRGTVTATSSTGFTMQSKNHTSLTVNTASAKLIRLPNTTIALNDIQVGDSVLIMGSKANNVVTASVVFDLAAHVRPATAKGTVTAVNGSTLTLLTKNGKTVTATTDANTQITNSNGQTASMSDIQVGSKVKLMGLWDKVVNAFTSILSIRIK